MFEWVHAKVICAWLHVCGWCCHIFFKYGLFEKYSLKTNRWPFVATCELPLASIVASYPPYEVLYFLNLEDSDHLVLYSAHYQDHVIKRARLSIHCFLFCNLLSAGTCCFSSAEFQWELHSGYFNTVFGWSSE